MFGSVDGTKQQVSYGLSSLGRRDILLSKKKENTSRRRRVNKLSNRSVNKIGMSSETVILFHSLPSYLLPSFFRRNCGTIGYWLREDYVWNVFSIKTRNGREGGEVEWEGRQSYVEGWWWWGMLVVSDYLKNTDWSFLYKVRSSRNWKVAFIIQGKRRH